MTYRTQSIEAITTELYKINGLYRNPGASEYGAVGEAEEALEESDDLLSVLSKNGVAAYNIIKKVGRGAGGGAGNGGGAGSGGESAGQTREVPVLEPPSEKLRTGLDLTSFQLTMNSLLEKLIANLKLTTDETAARQTEDRIEVEKTALESASKRLSSKIQKNLLAMRKAAENRKILKIFSWVMVGLAVVTAVVGAGVAIAAAVAAGLSAALAGAAAAGASAAGASAAAAGGAAATGAAIGTTSIVSGVAVTTTAHGFTLTLASTSAAAATTTTGAFMGGSAATAAGGAASAGAAVGTTSVVGNVVVTTTPHGFTLSLATSGTGTGTAAATETVAKASEVIAKAMSEVVTKKAIVMALASAAMALTMQILDATGAMERMTKDFSSWLKKQGAKNADLTAQLVIGFTSMAAMFLPMVFGGNVVMNVFKFFQFGISAYLVSSAMGAGMMTFTVTQQGLSISAQYAAGMAGADVDEVRAMVQLVQQMLDETQEELSDILDKIQDLLGRMFEIIASALDAQKEIAQKTGQMA